MQQINREPNKNFKQHLGIIKRLSYQNNNKKLRQRQ